MNREMKLIEYSLEFHKRSSIALGNVRKYMKQGKYKQAMENYKIYKQHADNYIKKMGDEE